MFLGIYSWKKTGSGGKTTSETSASGQDWTFQSQRAVEEVVRWLSENGAGRLPGVTLWRTLIDAVPMVTMAQSAANWRNTHTDRTHSLTVHQHSYNHVVRSASSAINSIIVQCMLGLFVFP